MLLLFLNRKNASLGIIRMPQTRNCSSLFFTAELMLLHEIMIIIAASSLERNHAALEGMAWKRLIRSDCQLLDFLSAAEVSCRPNVPFKSAADPSHRSSVTLKLT
jgi:hypothetical protein